MKLLGGCEAWAKLHSLEFRCCGSCHYDEDEGYDSMAEVDRDGDYDYEKNGGWYVICCAALYAFRKDI